MKYFVGIVPSKNIYDTILNIQTQFGDNRVEPHITLCPPATPLNEPAWLEAIKSVTTQFEPFTIELPATGFFGNRVLFIDVKSEEVYALQTQLASSIKSFEPPSPKSNNKYHPHLTLGRLWCGFTKHDFAEMKKLSDKFLTTQTPTFTADSIRVYHKPQHNKRWEPFEDLQLHKDLSRNI
jgi:2'-5' RNA ligase